MALGASAGASWESTWRQGGAREFEPVVREYEARLMSYLRHMTRTQAEAEDLVQESFLRLFQARRRVPRETPIDAYLFRVARNLSVSQQRRAVVERRSDPRGVDVSAVSASAIGPVKRARATDPMGSASGRERRGERDLSTGLHNFGSVRSDGGWRHGRPAPGRDEDDPDRPGACE